MATEEIERGSCTRCQCMDARLRCANYCTVTSCDDGHKMETDSDGCCYCVATGNITPVRVDFSILPLTVL